MKSNQMLLGYSRLPTLEIGAYFSIWIGAVLWALYKFYLSSRFFIDFVDTYDDFINGWSILGGRRKDISDYEWQIYVQFLYSVTPWFIIYLCLTYFARILNLYKLLPFIHTLPTFLFLMTTTNMTLTVIIFVQPILFALFSKTKSKILIWTCCLITLIINTYLKLLDENQTDQYFKITGFGYYITILATFWLNLRCLSFYLGQNNHRTFFDLLHFCFYFPTFFTGPFIDYEQIKYCLEINTNSNILILIRDLTRALFWFVFVEIATHFVYVNATTFQIDHVSEFDCWTLYGFGYALGSYFQLKYVIIFGISTAVAKFEGVPVPNTPKCIGRIHLYSDMWRYFDEGLYKFLLKHIYIPTIYINTFWNQALSSLLCFIFIYVWHGLQYYIFVWSFYNYIVIVIEKGRATFYRTYFAQKNWFTPYWERRLYCLTAAPVLAVAIMSNFYFIGGLEVGHVFFERFFNGTPESTLILFIILSCLCQVSVEFKRYDSRRNISKPD